MQPREAETSGSMAREGCSRTSLSSVLSELLGTSGLSQAQLAKRAGLSRATLNRWLRGISSQPYHRAGVLGIAAALDLNRVQANRLLRAAGLPALEVLAASDDLNEQRLLARWQARVRNNLPADLTSFVGRVDEAASVAELLARDDARLVTFSGPGGSGKTRLAIRVARDLLDAFPDGVFFVSLVAVADPRLVVTTVAETIGLRDVLNSSLEARLADWLRERRMLLVLDNFEHLADAAPSLGCGCCAPRRVSRCSSPAACRCMSSGEHEWPVEPLPMPKPRQPRSPAARQLGGRSFSTSALGPPTPVATSTPTILPAVVEICNRLDGLPLAIELAAARTRDRDPEQLLIDFPNRLDLSSDGPRDLPRHQQTLRDTIAWSVDLLSGEAHVLFRRLAVFSGGWTREAALAVCGDAALPASHVDALLRTLLDAHLIEPTPVHTGEPRFRMLETIREFARERLDEAGEAAALADRHGRYVLDLAESAPPYVPEARLGDWYERIDADLDNIRVALTWASRQPAPELLARFAASLWPYWHEYMHVEEGRNRLEAVLGRGALLPAALQASVLIGACILAFVQTDYQVALARGQAALPLWRQLEHDRGQALTLLFLGWAAYALGDFEQARDLFDASLHGWRVIADPSGIARVLCDLGVATYTVGDFSAAVPYLMEAEAIFRETHDAAGIARVLRDRGLHALLRGEIAEASALLGEAVNRLERIERTYLLLPAILYLGVALTLAGHLDEATRKLMRSLELREAIDDKHGLTLTLLGFAAVAHRRGDGSLAAMLCGASHSIQRDTDIALPPAVQAFYEREIGQVQEMTGPEEFVRAFARGAELTTPEAVGLARAKLAVESTPPV